jgi:hypothetical protein
MTDAHIDSSAIKELMKIAGDLLTETQHNHITAILNHDGNRTAAAESIGLSRAAIRQSIKALQRKAANLGYSPEHDMTKTTVAPYRVKGTSTMYGPDGETILQWVKTERDKAAFLEEIKETVHEIIQDLPPVAPCLDIPDDINEHTHAFYPLGDPHIGMLSWGEETGKDWDLEIAERTFLPVFDSLVRSAPKCAECTIIDLGDFWHSDNYEMRTSRSGQKVDQDGRYAKMIKVGYRIMMMMINIALHHHGVVNVKILPGNHDDVGSLFLRESLTHIYMNEPRVIIDQSVSVFQYTQWGQSLLGFHHGHTCKMIDLPMVMAADHPSWSECTHRYWYTGHIHHDSSRNFASKDFQGCKVESFRVIPPNEAYAHEHGYRAGRDSKCIIIHKERGEIARYTQDIEHVESEITP